MKLLKKTGAVMMAVMIGAAGIITGCSTSEKKVVIYSNADDEAVTAMKNALDSGGYKDKYIMQSFGTSELGGKLLAEGSNIEADMVTMSTFYLKSAQEKNKMFKDLTFDYHTLSETPLYAAPITAQEGSVILNTELMKEDNLPVPKSLKDLGNDCYKDMLSVTDITASSTAWLLIQGLVSAYGEDGAEETLAKIYKNAGPHIESSGSAPLKKVRAGEVAVGFGLRHQAVADKKSGLPVDYVDPEEGNFSLTESVAVVDKKDNANPLAMEMAKCVISSAREELLRTYPIPLYVGETGDSDNKSGNPKVFSEELTVDLLEKHQKLSERAKLMNQ